MGDVDVIVVGAGVVGLACAHALARHGRDVMVVERHARVGSETSSRNSGVIHAGIHGPADSLKSATCIAGRERLYAWCRRRGVPHRQTGKLIVAAPEEQEALEKLATRAEAKGLRVERLNRDQLRRREPLLDGVAIRIAESGIVDAHAFVDSVKRAALDHGADLVLGHAVTAITHDGDAWRVHTATDSIRARVVVNAAGLVADQIAMLVGVNPDARGWRIHPWKGEYFRIHARQRPEHALVYPLPVRGGLGIHLTRDLSGRLLAGPDASPGSSLDVEPDKASAFEACVRRYWPSAPSGFTPDYAGIRPKLQADGAFADFVVSEEPRGVIHLIGIESPGLTAALELGALVEKRIADRLA